MYLSIYCFATTAVFITLTFLVRFVTVLFYRLILQHISFIRIHCNHFILLSLFLFINVSDSINFSLCPAGPEPGTTTVRLVLAVLTNNSYNTSASAAPYLFIRCPAVVGL